MRSVPLRLYGWVILSAFLQLLPFPLAGPVPVWRRVICWFCLVPLLLALLGKSRTGQALTLWQSTLLAYLCGVLWFAGNCYWIYQTMFLYGGLPSLVSFGILILFSLYLGLYFALLGFLFALLRRGQGAAIAVLLFPLLWVTVELARARVTGFPWDLLGYTQIDNALLRPLAPWTGVMGLSVLVAAGNALWLAPVVFKKRARWGGLAGAAVCLLCGCAGAVRQGLPEKGSQTAILVQDNLSVGAEARGHHEEQAELLANLTQQTMHPQIGSAQIGSDRGGSGPPQIVAWPEAPTPFQGTDPEFREAIGHLARTLHAPVVVDAVASSERPNPETRRFDEFVSASFFLPDGSYAGRYDKMHLVPFGEYTPYKQLFFFAGHLLDQLVFVPGTQRRLFSVNGRRYGVFICYESIFGDEVRQFALSGAQALVNLTDDGWYGDTSAPWEHLDMARMRAVENHRWLLRDTNTGLTASIDPEGHIVASMPRHVRGAMEVPFSFERDLTFYTRHGDWIGWLCAIVIAAVIGGSLLDRRYPRIRQQVN